MFPIHTSRVPDFASLGKYNFVQKNGTILPQSETNSKLTPSQSS